MLSTIIATHCQKILHLVQELVGIGSSASMLHYLQNHDYGTNTWKGKIKKWTLQSRSFQTVRDMVIANKINELLLIVDEYISNCFFQISYIAPLRATAERYYRMQELAVDQVDSQGKNLAMFLQNLTELERKKFAHWTQKNFGFFPQVHATGGHFYLTLKELGGQKAFNLADTGFGFSQILPVITELWWLTVKPQKQLQRRLSRGFYFPNPPLIFAIEQPELHLHPGLQAKLADTFLAAITVARKNKIDLRLIVETHSETIINRLGHRIANGDIERQNINIAIFEKEHANASAVVRTTEYDEEGFLINWPFGFFEPDII